MRIVNQTSPADCGAAALQMIFRNFGLKLPYTEVCASVGVGGEGASLYGLCKASEKYAVRALALSGTFEQFSENVRNGQIVLPVIVRIVNHQNMAHFVVVEKMTDKFVKILDPDPIIGKVKISAEDFSQVFLGEVVVFEKSDAFRKIRNDKNPLLQIFKSVFHHKIAVMAIVMIGFILSAIGIFSSNILKNLVDNVMSGGDHEALELFSVMVTALAISYIFKFGLQLVKGKLSSSIFRKVNEKLMNKGFSHLLDLPIDFFISRNTGDVISRFDTDRTVNTVLTTIFDSILNVTMFIISGLIIYGISPEIFAISVIMILSYAAVSFIFNKPLKKLSGKVLEDNADIQSCLKESSDNIISIKSCGCENVFRNKFSSKMSSMHKAISRLSVKSNNKNSLIELLFGLGTIVIFWMGAVMSTEGALTAGSFVMIFNILNMFFNPVMELLEVHTQLQEAGVSAARFAEILNTPAESDNSESTEKITSGNIAFENVTFAYTNRRPVLKNIAFEIAEGTSNAFVGESGSGKTTVAKLMSNLQNATGGSILVDGKPIESFSNKEIRNNVAYVPQETSVFNATVRENLVFNNEREISDEEITELLKSIGAEFVFDLPMGLDTVLAEDGNSLSGGQRQKLSIARTILRAPKVIILDEATANLDKLSAQKVVNTINSMPMTKIWISHDHDLLDGCDNIFSIKSSMIQKVGMAVKTPA